MTLDIAAPSAIVWERLNDPVKRSEWDPGTHWRAGERPGGRTGPGSRNHCAHGGGTTTETVLDWKPFDYCTSDMVGSDGNTMTMTWKLEPLETGTRFHALIRIKAKLPGFLRRRVARYFLFNRYHYDKVIAAMAKQAEADASVVEETANA